MRIALFDDMGGGHRPAFMAGLSAALAEEGHRVVAFGAPTVDGEPPPGVERWYPVADVHPTALRRGRTLLAEAVHHCARDGVTVWCDLDLTRNVLRVDERLLQIPHRVHVVHRVNRYAYRGRSALGRLRTYYSRRRLAWLARHGSGLVVHTGSARDFLGRLVPRESLALLPLPVESPAAAGRGAPSDRRGRPVRALFVGRVRPDRGFDTLLQAAAELAGEITLAVVGRQDPGLSERVAREHPGVEIDWEDRYVAPEELRAAYRRAELVVLPYDGSFGASGSASMVLLEAMAHGVPIVASPAVGALLPAGFSGAIVADRHGPAALVTALRRAVAHLTALAGAAAVVGPLALRERHTYTLYARALLDTALAGPQS